MVLFNNLMLKLIILMYFGALLLIVLAITSFIVVMNVFDKINNFITNLFIKK